MKLISMTSFILEQLKINQSCSEFKEAVKNYANFLKQPLTLGMFVPCDEEGNVLEPVIQMNYVGFEDYEPKHPVECYEYDLQKYQEAKQLVLFEGFEFSHDNDYNSVVSQKTNSGIKVEIQFRKYEKDVRIIINSDYIHDCGSIERLIGLDRKPILTESAKQKLGL